MRMVIFVIYLYQKEREAAQIQQDRKAEAARRKLREQQAALEAESRRGTEPVAGGGGIREYGREYGG